MIAGNRKAIKEYHKLWQENKELKRKVKQQESQIDWLAKQIFRLSKKYGSVTYGGEFIYREPFDNYKDWIKASIIKKINHQDEIISLLESLHDIAVDFNKSNEKR